MRIKNRLYPADYLGKVGRMSTEDYPLWQIYVKEYGHLYDSFAYDYPLGDGTRLPKSSYDKNDDDYAHLTRKRVDAVGYTWDNVHLFEIKPRLSPKAIGQALCYKELYIKQHPKHRKITSYVVSQLANEDDLYCAMKLGIQVVLVE